MTKQSVMSHSGTNLELLTFSFGQRTIHLPCIEMQGLLIKISGKGFVTDEKASGNKGDELIF